MKSRAEGFCLTDGISKMHASRKTQKTRGVTTPLNYRYKLRTMPIHFVSSSNVRVLREQ